LIELLEKLTGPNADEIDQNMFSYTVAFLVMYVNHHFSLEEEYMKAYACPDLAFHKKEHAEYVQQLKKFREKYSQHSK
jgi:hemerythrin-like metal-binding protein